MIRINPGCQGAQTPWHYERNLDARVELPRILRLCKSVRSVNWLEAVIIPVRVNTLGNALEDVLFPLVVHGAWKTDSVALNLLAFPFFLLIDLITLPFRCFTVFIRSECDEASPLRHPLYSYLRDHGANLSLWIENDPRLLVQLEWQDGRERKRREMMIDLIATPPGAPPPYVVQSTL